jgi:hypothetical protein
VLSYVEGSHIAPEQLTPEYALNNITSLLNWNEIRQDDGQYIEFFKWGCSKRIDICRSRDASNTTMNELKSFLESWRFDQFPSGDPDWTVMQACRLLPESVGPKSFPLEGHVSYEGITRATEVKVDGKTVHIRFIYGWNNVTIPRPVPADFQFNSYHWWKIDMLPDGNVTLTGEGGKPLPN